MKGDKCVVCPKCGSKDISKRLPANNNSVIISRGFYYCRNCKNISRQRDLITLKEFKKI